MRSKILYLLLACQAVYAKPGINWQPPKHFHSLKPINFELAEFPGDSFLLIFPEWLTSREKSWHVRPVWKTDGTKATAMWNSAGISVGLTLAFHSNDCGHKLEWVYEVMNGSEDDLTDVALFNCFNFVNAPTFRDLGMTRTWIRQGNRNTTQLSTVEKTQASRTIQFYPAKGGILLTEFQRFMRYGATNTTELAGDRIAVDSVDGKWTLESIVDGQVAYFFNNWEDTHGCIHAAPLLGNLPTGKSTISTGRLHFKKTHNRGANSRSSSK